MEENLFFKPTLLYKEYLILDLIAKDASITQRMMSEALGVSVSLVNGYLDKLESNRYIKRRHQSTKTVDYTITDIGIERIKVLNIGFIKSSHLVYESARRNVLQFFDEIARQNKRKILLYGAGEVADVLISTLLEARFDKITIIGVVDDSIDKQGLYMHGIPIGSFDSLTSTQFDGLVISSYTNHSIIKSKVTSTLPKEKIIDFFYSNN
jgi:DNA-binding MarR family transcriptional regulator